MAMSAAGLLVTVRTVDAHQVASVIKNREDSVLIIDSRSFLEHNACHISSAVNVCCSKIVKRRLQQDKLSVKELLTHTCHCDYDEKLDVVVYDQSSKDVETLPVESFTNIILKKLQPVFRSVNLLSGGFVEFHKFYPELCEDKTRKCAPLTSISQPCLPIANQGPTRILPFLYLGSQFDALNKDLLKDHNITYELNVSTSCPQPEFVPEGHFMRIPVNDTYSEKLLPYFPEAFRFLDKVREGSGCALVHCLGGVSRSPTIAIAYVMRYLRLSSDDGYRYVKSKRPTISPNFNFLGQLLEYEKQLRKENILEAKPEATSAPPLCSKKRLCRTDMRTTKLSLDIDVKKPDMNFFVRPPNGDQSPTTALAKLSFDAKTTPDEKETQPFFTDFKQYRSKSCYGDWLRDRDDSYVDRKAKELSSPSKVLSPVKEIKCDGLISEISSSEREKSLTSTKLRRQSKYGNDENKYFNLFSHLDRQSSWSSEKFSIQTLTHQSTYVTNSSRCKEQQKAKTKLIVSQFLENKSYASDRKFDKNRSADSVYKRVFRLSPERSTIQSAKKEHTESPFYYRKISPFSFNVDPSRRSDSAGTSGFGSEASDCADKKPDGLDVDFDELEDDVLMKNNSNKLSAINRTFFPLSLPSLSTSRLQKQLESPISPSESHLLEDLEMDKERIKAGPSSPCHSSSKTDEVCDNFEDSGVPMSPPWVWPNKNGAYHKISSPTSDKQKLEPSNKLTTPSQTNIRTLWFNEYSYSDSQKDSLSKQGASFVFNNSDKVGLYRVQSCPGIVNQISSSYPSTDVFEKYSLQKYFRKDHYPTRETICHESCPDVLHLAKRDDLEFQSLRHKEFRRNIRTIQVS